MINLESLRKFITLIIIIEMIKIYTDGATSKNGQENSYGGWAYIILEEDKIISKNSGALSNVTNNQCELIAIINACNEISTLNTPVTVYSDSAYCINCYKQQWYKNWQKNGWLNSKKEPVANQELWEELIPFFENLNFTFEKVKGHSLNQFNNIVDKMAVEAKQCLM